MEGSTLGGNILKYTKLFTMVYYKVICEQRKEWEKSVHITELTGCRSAGLFNLQVFDSAVESTAYMLCKTTEVEGLFCLSALP